MLLMTRNGVLRKGFVSAPLLGTVIFLVCVVFIASLSKVEAQETARITNDAYHNRLVSLLEIYRTDLGTIFRASLSANIEQLLTKQNWLNLFRIENDLYTDEKKQTCETGYGGNAGCAGYDASSPGGGQGDPMSVSLKDSRYYGCRHINEVITQIICSTNTNTCDEQCNGDADCLSKCQSYGLPEWIGYLDKTVTFEGITFSPANPEVFNFLLEQNPENYQQYEQVCRLILAGSAFNCDAFAEGNFREPLVADKACTTNGTNDGDAIQGCGSGTFFVKSNIENSVVYPVMPRLNASDGKGNVIRSGAISDSDFVLPITYPLYDYYDKAFKVYSRLAYGKDVSSENEGADEGVVQGFCVEPSGGNCGVVEKFQDVGFTGDSAQTSELFYPNFRDACTTWQTGNEERISLEFCDRTQTCGIDVPDQDDPTDGWIQCSNVLSNQFTYAAGGFSLEECSANSAECGFFQELMLNYRFVDRTPANRIDSRQANAFAWFAAPAHECVSDRSKVGDCTP